MDWQSDPSSKFLSREEILFQHKKLKSFLEVEFSKVDFEFSRFFGIQKSLKNLFQTFFIAFKKPLMQKNFLLPQIHQQLSVLDIFYLLQTNICHSLQFTLFALSISQNLFPLYFPKNLSKSLAGGKKARSYDFFFSKLMFIFC